MVGRGGASPGSGRGLSGEARAEGWGEGAMGGGLARRGWNLLWRGGYQILQGRGEGGMGGAYPAWAGLCLEGRRPCPGGWDRVLEGRGEREIGGAYPVGGGTESWRAEAREG